MPRTHRYARHGQQYFVKVVMGTGRILCPPQCPGPRPSSRSTDALRHKQHAKTTHSKHTGQYSLGFTSKQPTANTQDNIHLGYRQLAAYPNPVPLGPHFRHYCQRPFPQNEFHYEFAKGKTPRNLPQPPQCKLTRKLCRSKKPAMYSHVSFPTCLGKQQSMTVCAMKFMQCQDSVFQTSQLDGNEPKVRKQTLKQGFRPALSLPMSIHLMWISAINGLILVQ